ncbi:unnamed protein product, partial [marine sediment metagenome]
MDILNDKEIREIRKSVVNFLEYYGMYYASIGIQKYVDIFLQEMQKGLIDAESSLKMFPTFIQLRREMPKN